MEKTILFQLDDKRQLLSLIQTVVAHTAAKLSLIIIADITVAPRARECQA